MTQEFQAMKMGELEFDDQVLLHQICEAIGVHRGDSHYTDEIYIAPHPVVNEASTQASPSYVLRLEDGVLLLQRRNVGNPEMDRPLMAVQPVFEFPLADPQFFDKLKTHVHRGWIR